MYNNFLGSHFPLTFIILIIESCINKIIKLIF